MVILCTEVIVNCRIGSLESTARKPVVAHIVNCRIGGLEKTRGVLIKNSTVNCRIGSLEKQKRQSLFMLQ